MKQHPSKTPNKIHLQILLSAYQAWRIRILNIIMGG
jgi:hypothetical protein